MWETGVGKGWRPIVEAFESAFNIYKLEQVQGWCEIVDIKEKYGRLRIYVDGYDETIDKMVKQAEHAAELVCEKCGKPGRIREERIWIKTLCDECNKGK